MRFLLVILFIFTLAALPAYSATTPSPVAKISLIKNKVQVKSATQDWHNVNTDDPLYQGDQVRTSNGSVVEITFLNTGSKIRLKDLSQATIEGESNDVKISFGKLFMAVVKGKGGMKVKSPVAVAAVLGTVGFIEYNPTENTYSVTSIDGTFAVTDTAGNTTNLTVGNVLSITTAGVIVNTADILNVIQSNANTLPPEFIQVGLSLDSIKTDPMGNTVIELNTANPKEKIQINTTSGEMNVIQIDTTIINNTTNNNSNPQPQDNPPPPPPPPAAPPATDITNTITNVTNTTTIIPTLPPATTVTVPIN